MKRILIMLSAAILVFTGCGSGKGDSAVKTGDVQFGTEKIIKEFAGTINIFNRAGDTVMLTAEDGESFVNYNADISAGQIEESGSANDGGQYIYSEPAGDRGTILVQAAGDRNILKFRSKDGAEKTIADNIGFSESVNVSVSPHGSRFAYTAQDVAQDTSGLYIYDIAASKSFKLLSITNEGLIAGFNYIVNWSPDEKYVIIQNKLLYEAETGIKKGELKSAYSKWSPSGSKIAFILEEGAENWLEATDYVVYPGKKICVYDMSDGSYQDVFSITNDEYVFGDFAWDGTESKVAFTGIRVKDKESEDWYMKLDYSSIYLVDVKDRSARRLETGVDSSNGELLELGNLKFTKAGELLCYTVGNFEKSSLHVVDVNTLESKTFENVEYLHWINGEDYSIAAGGNAFYFCIDNKLMRIDDKLQESVKYTSQAKLDDIYLSGDEQSVLLFESQDGGYVLRYLGK